MRVASVIAVVVSLVSLFVGLWLAQHGQLDPYMVVGTSVLVGLFAVVFALWEIADMFKERV